MSDYSPLSGALGKLGLTARGMPTLVGNGFLRPVGPSKLLRIHKRYRKWGLTLTLAFSIGAVRHPDRVAIVDDNGTLTYEQLDVTSTRLAHGLRTLGPPEGLRKIGLLCRNHRGVVATCIAAGKLGVDIVLLNTGLAGKQMSAVVEEQGIELLVVDQDLLPLTAGCPPELRRVIAWSDEPDGSVDQYGYRLHTLDSAIGTAPGWALPAPERAGKTVMLTSGTTGIPKGALRPDPPSLAPVAAMLDALPLRAGEVMVVAPPLFHIMGFGHLQLGAMLGQTLVLRRQFDAEQTLRDLAGRKASVLVGTPLMLRRLLEVPPETRAEHPAESLRVVSCGGSALPAMLSGRFMDAFGQVLYNLYGSTEVSWATIATPKDLTRAPGTAGKPPSGTRVAVLDDAGSPAPVGKVGRIFVGNAMLFDGYTAGGKAESHRGLLRTGDLGYFDKDGRLFLCGREDDMIVSGGENVFPQEVEDVLSAHDDIREAAVIGVPDVEYGQRFRAYVVPEPGHFLTARQVLTHVQENLAKFSVPKEVVFLDVLPRNAAGKILHRDLL
jgi:acyl-CoA synthetase (AMP-forming)/AMP-acid ligase II